MKIRNLISAALLVGVGSVALPAAAAWRTSPPVDLPSNCSVTVIGGPLLQDIRGNTGPQPIYIIRCWAAEPPSWMTW